MIAILSEKEIFILENRINMTFSEIGEILKISRVRINQLESQAVKKLIHRLLCINKNPIHIYQNMKDEFYFFNYLIDNNIIDWYDIENNTFHRNAKDVRDKINKKGFLCCQCGAFNEKF